jgi:hypothetical protein
VQSPEAKDLTSFVPRPPELLPEDYRPDAVARIVPGSATPRSRAW